MNTTTRRPPRSSPTPKSRFAPAYVGLLCFFVVYYGRPNDWLPSLETFPFAKIGAALAVLGFVLVAPFHLPKIAASLRQSRVALLILAMFAWMCLTVPTATWPGGSFQVIFNDYWKVVLVALIIILVVDSARRLKQLFVISCLAVSIFCALVVRAYFAGELVQGRAWGPVSGVFGNPNELALQATASLPFAIFFVAGARNIFSRLWWLLCAAVLTLGTVATFSRGGFLSLLAVALALLFGRTASKRHRAALLIACLISVLALAVIPQYRERLLTMFSPEQEASAHQRKELLLRSLEITVRRPIFGVGPGNFAEQSGSWHVTHNAFMQWGAECGIPGLVLFVLLLRASFVNLRQVRSSPAASHEMILLAQALRISLIAFVVGALFTSVGYQLLTYYLTASSAALATVARAQEAAGGRTVAAAGPLDKAQGPLPQRAWARLPKRSSPGWRAPAAPRGDGERMN